MGRRRAGSDGLPSPPASRTTSRSSSISRWIKSARLAGISGRGGVTSAPAHASEGLALLAVVLAAPPVRAQTSLPPPPRLALRLEYSRGPRTICPDEHAAGPAG